MGREGLFSYGGEVDKVVEVGPAVGIGAVLRGVIGGGDCLGGELEDGEMGWEDGTVASEPNLVVVGDSKAGFFCERYVFLFVFD